MIFDREEEMQAFAQQIAKVFWSKGDINDIYNFVNNEFVPPNLINDVKTYLNQFDPTYWVVVLSYARLQLTERYKLV